MMRRAIRRCDLAHRDHPDPPQLKVESSVPNKVRASLVLEKRNRASWPSQRSLTGAVNRLGGLHGGVIASLVDTMGTLALSSRGMWLTGVVRAADAKAALIDAVDRHPRQLPARREDSGRHHRVRGEGRLDRQECAQTECRAR